MCELLSATAHDFIILPTYEEQTRKESFMQCMGYLLSSRTMVHPDHRFKVCGTR